MSSAVAGGQAEKVGHYTALRYEWVDRRERWAAFKMHSTVNLFQEWKLNRAGGGDTLQLQRVSPANIPKCTNMLLLFQQP